MPWPFFAFRVVICRSCASGRFCSQTFQSGAGVHGLSLRELFFRFRQFCIDIQQSHAFLVGFHAYNNHIPVAVFGNVDRLRGLTAHL